MMEAIRNSIFAVFSFLPFSPVALKIGLLMSLPRNRKANTNSVEATMVRAADETIKGMK